MLKQILHLILTFFHYSRHTQRKNPGGHPTPHPHGNNNPHTWRRHPHPQGSSHRQTLPPAPCQHRRPRKGPALRQGSSPAPKTASPWEIRRSQYQRKRQIPPPCSPCLCRQQAWATSARPLLHPPRAGCSLAPKLLWPHWQRLCPARPFAAPSPKAQARTLGTSLPHSPLAVEKKNKYAKDIEYSKTIECLEDFVRIIL